MFPGGFTVVLKSTGAAAEHQIECMGVYRMVDVFNDKPVYRQDVGDHYLYYNGQHNTWMVGSRVGHDFGWIKNSSPEHQKNRLPDLRTGWEYQPLARADHLDSHWNGDDNTLHVEVLRGERTESLLGRSVHDHLVHYSITCLFCNKPAIACLYFTKIDDSLSNVVILEKRDTS